MSLKNGKSNKPKYPKTQDLINQDNVLIEDVKRVVNEVKNLEI